MSVKVGERSWKKCCICSPNIAFKTPLDYLRHLREYHCTQEGGSFICKYGYNDVCTTLPGIGVSDEDYENHIVKHHAFQHHDVNIHSSRKNPQLGGREQPNVVLDRGRWTVYHSSQNLPAVLNDPSRGKQKDFFTKTWGDTFVEKTPIGRSPHLPEITRAHFEAYLKRTSKRHKRHSKHSTSVVAKPSVGEDNLATFPSLAVSKQIADKNNVSLQNIPKIFLMPQFNLENPDTFSTVFPWSQLSTGTFRNVKDGKSQQSSSKLLQEKLSHYLDVIEVQIAHQISLKSAAFFDVISSHDAVMEQLSQTLITVTKLRAGIHHIEDLLVKGSLRVMRLACSRQNQVAVYQKLKLMATVHQTHSTIQLLLTNSEFVGALDLIYTTREVLSLELRGIHCFRHLGSQLVELEKLIDTMMKSEFVRYVTIDLNRPLTDSNVIMEEDRLVAIVFGMMHQHCYAFIDIYKEEAFTAVKAVIKQTVIEIISQTECVDSDSYFSNAMDIVKALQFSQWLGVLKEVFFNCLKLLMRIKALHGVISDAVDIAGRKAHSPACAPCISQETPEAINITVAVNEEAVVLISDTDHTKLKERLKELLYAICEQALSGCSRLFPRKTKQKDKDGVMSQVDGVFDKLTSSEFVFLSNAVEHFMGECEEICDRKSTTLRLLLQNQANQFANQFHEEKKTKLSLILDSERWKQADVPSEFQELVDYISSTHNLVIPKRHSETDLVEEKKPQSFLIVDGKKYAVVGTVLLLLKMIMEYCQCVHDMPSVSTDLLLRLVEIFKMFNSRTCQLILGAGALPLVGLKTITTKNLALASRCLQLIVHYIPYVKQHFEQFLPSKQQMLVKNYDQVLKDYTDHIQEIVNKLVSIIDNMIDTQLDKWEVKPPVPSTYIRAICKHMAKLHEAIADLLPQDQIRELFIQINSSFKAKLKIHLQNLVVVNDGGPQHGLVTSEMAFYMQNIHSLTGLEGINLNMDDIWNKR